MLFHCFIEICANSDLKRKIWSLPAGATLHEPRTLMPLSKLNKGNFDHSGFAKLIDEHPCRILRILNKFRPNAVTTKPTVPPRMLGTSDDSWVLPSEVQFPIAKFYMHQKVKKWCTYKYIIFIIYNLIHSGCDHDYPLNEWKKDRDSLCKELAGLHLKTIHHMAVRAATQKMQVSSASLDFWIWPSWHPPHRMLKLHQMFHKAWHPRHPWYLHLRNPKNGSHLAPRLWRKQLCPAGTPAVLQLQSNKAKVHELCHWWRNFQRRLRVASEKSTLQAIAGHAAQARTLRSTFNSKEISGPRICMSKKNG